MNKESKLIFESYRKVVENMMDVGQPAEGVKKVVITKKAYGPSIDLEGPGTEDEYKGYGAMVRDVIDDPEAVSPESKQALLSKEQDTGQEFENWDSDVFSEYYDVDMEKVVNAWAKKHGYEVEIRDGYEDENSEQNINGEFIKNPDGTSYVKPVPGLDTRPVQMANYKQPTPPASTGAAALDLIKLIKAVRAGDQTTIQQIANKYVPAT